MNCLQHAPATVRPRPASCLCHSRLDLRRYAEDPLLNNDIEDAVQESMILVPRKLGDVITDDILSTVTAEVNE